MSKSKLNKQQRRHREQFDQFEDPEPDKPQPAPRAVAKVPPQECPICHMWMDSRVETCPSCSHQMK